MGKFLAIAGAASFIVALITPAGAQTASSNQTVKPTKVMPAAATAYTGMRPVAVPPSPVMFEAGKTKASMPSPVGHTEAPVSGNSMNWLQGGGG